MSKAIVFVFFAHLGILAHTTWGAETRCCGETGCFGDSYPYHHLPLPDCPVEFRPVYKLYTQDNPDTPVDLDKTSIPQEYDGSAKNIFLIHGFLNNENDRWMSDAKDALLSRGEKLNIIMVGWGQGANKMYYPRSASNTRTTGADANLVLQNLIRNGGSSASRTYCVGFSLGAHVCGHIGWKTKLARITGLDPAGPMFTYNVFTGEVLDPRTGLHPDCAALVDNIHTHGSGGLVFNLAYGTLRPMGHLDFYPNGAKFPQPGCLAYGDHGGLSPDYFVKTNSTKSHKRSKRQLEFLYCTHSRACDYFVESILTSCFIAQHRCSDEEDLPGSCTEGAYAEMGYHAAGCDGMPQPPGLYHLTTNETSPFCLG